MRRLHAQSLFALGTVAFIGIGIPIAARVEKYDGPVMFAVGTLIAALIAERTLFREKPPPEPRGFPIEPTGHKSERRPQEAGGKASGGNGVSKLPLDYESPDRGRPERSFWKAFLSLPKWSQGDSFLLTCILYMLLLLGLLYLLIHGCSTLRP